MEIDESAVFSAADKAELSDVVGLEADVDLEPPPQAVTPKVYEGTVAAASTAWDDPAWTIEGDTRWAAGCRWLQSWWRANRIGAPAGPFDASDPTRLVASTLPFDEVWRSANFLNDAVAEAVEDRLRQRNAGGLVKPDRLRRNLLSSQPLCFNLFGYLAGHRDLIARWLRSIGCDVAEVTAVHVEWAPPKAEHFGGGSAFDAFIAYRRADDELGFVGIETKYAEHLPTNDVAKVRDTYKDFTVECGRWRDGAVERLDRRGLRQLWLNTLLAQSLELGTVHVEGRAVVCSCAADRSARELVDAVRSELVDPHFLTWHPFEEILAAVDDPSISEWTDAFRERYLDFGPVAHLMAEDDPRRAASPNLAAGPADALAVAERVFGDGSVLAQLAEAERPGADALWARLALLMDDMKQLRIDAGRLFDAEQDAGE